MKKTLLGLALFGSMLVISLESKAFPELARHGYVNCSSCHVSPSGGGITTPYGRSLSRELLSTWGKENEELLGHGLLKAPPEWLNVGGDYRFIQTYLDTATTERTTNFTMQADLETAVTVGKWVIDATAGVNGGPRGTPKRGEFVSRRHYLLYRVNDPISVRLGKFYPQFGINQPDHSAYTRKNNGFDQSRETYNLEFNYAGEFDDFFVSVIAGRPDDLRRVSEHGGSLSYSRAIKNETKVGVSLLATESRNLKREALGFFGIVKASEKLYVLSEIDLTSRHGTPAGYQPGLLSYQQLAYEAIKGLHFFGLHQLAHPNFRNGSTRRDSYGVGVKFYPRPHFEISSEFLRERDLQVSNDRYEVAWLVLHYYL